MLSKFKELFKHSLLFGIGEILAASVGIILIPLYTREFTPDEYGILSLLLICFTYLTTISPLGINSALIRSYYDYDKEEDRSKVFGTALLILIAGSIISSGIFISLSSFISMTIFSSTKYIYHFILLGITNVFQSANLYFMSIMRAQKQSLRYSIFNFISFLNKIMLIILFVALLQKGVLGVIYGLNISAIIHFCILIITSKKDVRLSFIFSEFKKLLRFGGPLIFVNLVGIIMSSLDRFIIKYYTNLTEVGLYNLGYQIGSIVFIVLVSPFGLIWPSILLSVRNEDDAKEFYARVMTYFVYIGLLLSLVIGIFSSEILNIFGTAQYRGAGMIIFPVCLSYLFIGMSNILHVGISINRRTEFSIPVISFAAFVNLILNFLLVPYWGIIGAAFAAVCATFFMVLLKNTIVRKIYYIKYEWGRIFKLFAVAIGLYFISNIFVIKNVWNTILFKSFLVTIFPILLYFLRFYRKVEIETILSFVKKI